MKRVALVVALLLVIVSGGAAAHKGEGEHTPAAPNPYVVSDPTDPSVLHPAPGFAERGFDAGYIKAFARPHVSGGEVRAEGVHLSAPTDLPAPNPMLALQGHVFVIEGTADLYASNGEFDAQGNALFNVAQDVLGSLGDQFDFISVFTTTPNNSEAAFYLPLKNDIQGLGECNFNQGATFGCQFNQLEGSGINQLQGLVFMNSLGFWKQWDENVDGVVHPFDDFNQAVYSVLGQEIAHRWASALRFKDPRNGEISKKLLGRDQSHWAAFVDTDASVMDGWDWEKPKDGRFDLVNDMDIYSTLDLYAMGALPVASAKPFFFIDGAKYDVKNGGNFLGQLQGRAIGAADVLELGLPSVQFLSDNGIDLGATGQEVDLTIQDIVNAEGNRCPDPDHTQRSYRQAIVLVTRPGETAAQAASQIADLETVATTWEAWWRDRTGHAITLCTTPNDDCQQAIGQLSGGNFDVEGGADFIERGQTATFHMVAGAAKKIAEPAGDAVGATVKKAHIALDLQGGGAKKARLTAADVDVGDVTPGSDVDVPVDIHVDPDFECGSSLIVVAQLEADNAPTVREEYRLFPGYANLFVDDFRSDGSFTVNADGGDNTASGALVRSDVALNCDISPRSPEKDNTPGSAGAFITGEHDELKGTSSLWSREIDLSGTAAPELAYDFWLDGEPNDSLLVELSEDGKKFVSAAEEHESFHGWGLNRVALRGVFGHVPKKVTARFTFNGGGHLEGGIDNVLVIDPQGQCRSIQAGICGCTTDGSAAPQATLAFVLGLLGLRIARRKR